MNKVIKPEVVITNNDEHDELFLWNGISQHAPWLGLPHIALPHAASDLSWVSDLDTDSLKGSLTHVHIRSRLSRITDNVYSLE